MILVIDNYDSFTFNLCQALGMCGARVVVRRNDALDMAGVRALDPTAVVISPGPGRPQAAGITPTLIRELSNDVALLGVCLGHQALIEGLGGELICDPAPAHGKSSLVHHDTSALFRGMPTPFPAGRYHSLQARQSNLPSELILSGWTEAGEVMAVRHKARPWFGVQFHPESILTPMGARLIANFANLAGEPSRRMPA